MSRPNRLTIGAVRFIKSTYELQKPGPRGEQRTGYSMHDLAKAFGVSQQAIFQVIDGISYREVKPWAATLIK